MTNALAQNIKIEDNSNSLDLIMQAVNVSSDNSSEAQKTQGFSNILNNLDSRFKKAQSEFDKKVKISNTSSINQKALDNKEPKEITQPQANVNQDIKNSKNQKNINKFNKIEKETPTSKQELSDTKVENNPKKDSSKDLSDINNSSPVNSSPVFSSDEIKNTDTEDNNNIELKQETKETTDKIEIEVEKIINSIPISDENIKYNIKDIKSDIENLLENIENSENIENLSQKIEEISTNIDNSNLNQDQKEEVLKFLDEIKNTNEIKTSDELKTKFKNLFDEILDNSSQKVNLKDKIEPIFTKETEKNEDIKTDTKIIDKSVNLNFGNQTKEEINSLIKDIKNHPNEADGEKLNEISNKISSYIETLSASPNETELKDELIENLKNLQILLKDYKTTTSNDIKSSEVVDNSSISKNEAFKILDNLSTKDFEKIDTSDKKSMDKILNTFDDLTKEIQDLNIDENTKKEIETKIQNLTKEIATNSTSNEELNKELNKIINDITNEVKIDRQNETTISDENKIINITSKLEDVLNTNNNYNNSQNQNKENSFEQKSQEVEFDFKEITDKNIETKEINLKNSINLNNIKDTKNIEENLQKTIAINDIMDEMMVEVDIKTIPTQSGALSVSDEIAKLAIGENNSLNPITSAHSSITYDSTGVNAIIKNAATMMKTSVQNAQNPSMEDILNQVTNKISQLKDNTVQKLTMILRPNDLGRLSIELSTNKDGLTTNIMAQNEDVRAYIEKNIDSLRQQLSQAGINVNSIQIKTAGTQTSNSYDGNQNFNQEQNQQNSNQEHNTKHNQENQNNQHNRHSKEALAALSNYEMRFKKDFSSVLNNTLNYNLN